MLQIIIITSLTTTTIIGRTINIVPKQGFNNNNNNINKIIKIKKDKDKDKDKDKNKDIENILAEIYYREVLLKEKGFIKKKENRKLLEKEIKELKEKLKKIEKLKKTEN